LREAEASFHKALEIEPAYGNFSLGLTYLMEGREDEALAAIQKESTPALRFCGLAVVNHALHRKRESDSALADLTSKYSAGALYLVAEVYAFRGEADRAFEWLDRAITAYDSGISGIRVDPLFKPIRSDPRYKALLVRLRFP
jgi:tetratricopeptide (TPR) repeat protein